MWEVHRNTEQWRLQSKHMLNCRIHSWVQREQVHLINRRWNLLAFDIFDPANLPLNKDCLTKCGVEQLCTLTKHFGPLLHSQGCDLDMVEKEWLFVKYDIHRNQRDMNLQDLWKKMMSTPGNKRNYHNILHLVQIMLIEPARVEHNFSFTERFLGDFSHLRPLRPCCRSALMDPHANI